MKRPAWGVDLIMIGWGVDDVIRGCGFGADLFLFRRLRNPRERINPRLRHRECQGGHSFRYLPLLKLLWVERSLPAILVH